MAAPQEWLRVNPPPTQRKTEVEGGAFAAYEESGRMPEAMFGQHNPASSSRHQARRHRRRGAPGLLACSQSSDEIQRTTNVALSPVTGPGATSFSSVASAFDFQHHIGSDPASELLVLKNILARECLLSRLEAVCDQLRKRFQLLPAATAATPDSATARLGEDGDGIVDLLSKMRGATVAVIEAISVWRKDMTGHPPSAFVWHGDNYLLKITNDLNFLAGVQPLVNTLKMHPARFCRNPLMLPQTLDEQRRDGELYEGGEDTVSPGAGRRRHLYQVAQVLLDEESLESERDFLRQETTKSTSALPARGETSPELSGRHGFGAAGAEHGVRSCSTTSGVRTGVSQDTDGGPASYSLSQLARGRGQTEDDALRRQHLLSTWYEEARSQLVSLSTSPADEEYFLRSRRFWSKEELGETGSGCSPPPPHRRPPGTLTRGGKRSALTADAVTGRDTIDGAQISGTERLSDGEGSDRADLFGERLSNRHQRGLPPPRRTRRSRGPRSDGQEANTTVGSARQNQGGDGDAERGGADVWSRPDRFGGGNSAALSCLTVDDIEQVLREVDPLPATVAVCAAVVFLLSPEDQPPADFLWPQGFEAVALPVEDFLWRLHGTSGGTASSTKARFLAPVLQREYLLPEVIGRQGGHAVASLCAWALEELQVCEEFAEWSETALEPWYETQLVPIQPDAPESSEVGGCEVKLVYKALHMLPHAGASYVISLFEDKGEEGGFIVRAFDRAKRDAFWLSLTKNRVALLGENATRSPATLAATLTRRLKLKSDAGTGKIRLVLPPAKKVESSSEKKTKNVAPTRVVHSSDDVAGQAVVRAAMGAVTTPSASPSLPVNEAATAVVPECPSAQAKPRRQRRSHPPPTRGSKVQDLGPLVENEGDVSECSAVPSTSDGKVAAAVADGRVVEQSDKGSAAEEISVKTETAAAASKLTGEHQEQSLFQTTNASEPALVLSKTRSEPRATTNSDEVKGEGLQEGLWEAGMEESGSYAEDFTPDNDEDKRPGLGRDVDSYADDFADDGDEPNDHDRNEVDRRETQQGVENAEAADAGAASSGVATATPGVCRGGTTGSAEALAAIGPAGMPISELAVEGLGTNRRSDEPPQEVQSPRTSRAAVAQEGPSHETQQPSGEGESTDVGSIGQRSAETEVEEEGYEDEFLEESVEQYESADVNVDIAELTKPEITTKTEQPRPPPTDGTSAEDDGVSTSRALQPQESTSLARDGVDPAQQTDQEGWQHPSPCETTHNLMVLDDTIADESDGCGRLGTELVAEAAGQKVGNDTQRELLAEDNKSGNLVQALPTLIDVDPLGNTGSVSALEGYAPEFDEDPKEGFEDNFEASTASTLAASTIAAAAVTDATDLALELVSERSKIGLAEVGALDVPDTDVAVAERIGKERALGAGVTATAATAQNPSPMERRRFPEGEAPLTGRAPEDCFEESFEDDTDENDAVKSAGDSTSVAASCSEFSSVVAGADIPPPLSEQDNSEGPTPVGLGGEQPETDGEELEETYLAVEKVVHESLTTEYEGFEEDFDENFEEDVEEDIASGRPKEQREDVDSGVTEDLDPREPAATAIAAAAAARREDPVGIPPPVEEVIGNQDEDRSGNGARRKSVDVARVAPVAGPSGDRFEDDFDEDDFEDP